MNEQEMQFADPDWKPTGSVSAQQANAAAQASASIATTASDRGASSPQAEDLLPYSNGYKGSWPEQPPFSSAPQSAAYLSVQQGTSAGRGRSHWLIWVIIAVVLISISGGMFHPRMSSNYSASQSSFPHHRDIKQFYALNETTQVSIVDPFGAVSVQVSDDQFQGVEVVASDGSQPQVDYQGPTMAISMNDASDITIYLPQNVALNLQAGQNNVEVDGFTGQLNVQTNSGQIRLQNDTLSQGSLLTTNSGDINLEQGSAQDITITSATGSIILDQTNLSGQIALSTGGNGTISYRGGTLDPQGKYQFKTESGAIDLALPSDTELQTKVTQHSGSYHSDFPDSTGTPPQASIDITTDSGDVTITAQ